MTNPACSEAREALLALIDGELSSAEAERVEAHLAGCAACAAERRAHEAAWEALELLEPISARPGWLEQVEREILAAPAPAGRVLRLRGWMVAAAAAVLVAVGLALSGAWTRSGGPEVAVDPAGPVDDGLTLDDDLAPGPDNGTTAFTTAELALVLPPEDVELVEELEVLVLLAELEDADLIDSLDLLWELDEEEFDEG